MEARSEGSQARLRRVARKLVVRFEEGIDFDAVRFSGLHACRDADHERDSELRRWLTGRVAAGRGSFLLDVRELYVTYPSGMGDLLNSFWGHRVRGEASPMVARLAILWRPSLPSVHRIPDRWRMMAASIPNPTPSVGLFEDEGKAMAYLASDPGSWEHPSTTDE